MPEMSFAQALNEARQIIVQQSNRIKGDLDKIKALQETITTQTAAIAEADRNFKLKATELDGANDHIRSVSAKLDETRLAKEQGEAVIDRQGQRLTQMQQSITDLEKQVADQLQKIQHLTHDLELTHGKLPTNDDHEALAALASLLSAKKGAPTPPKNPDENAAAA